MSHLRELYQEVILDHGRHPRNFGGLSTANYHKEGYNPLCGDKVTLHLELENNVIKNAMFEGCGCAISIASASLMTESIRDKALSEIDNLFQAFQIAVTEGTTDETLGKLTIFAGVAEFPMRVKCATLAWHTLKALLSEENA